MTSPDKITYFGETDARNKRVKFGIKAEDRTRHMYVIGKTGMGKSTLLENMAVQDIQSGEGLCFIDPHGKSAELLLNYIPEHRVKDVVYFAPFDIDYPIAFNVMEDVGYDKRHLVVSGLMATFKKIWVDAWSARMEYILSNTLLALLEYPGATLLGVNKMYADKEYRKKVVANITDPAVKSFWVDEFAKYTDKFAAEATPAIQNKIGQFTNNPLIRNIIGQPKSSFDIRKMMDERKILIVNLSKGRVGESNANLLGAMIITKVYLAAMSRADASEKQMKALPNFYLYVDEFQSFANESFADILSEARKYKLNLTIAHQYVEQMTDEVRAAVFGNVGTMIVFRVGSIDAEQFEKEFAPQFTADDIVNLGKYQMYLRLMIDGVGSQPFSATNLPPIALPPVSFREQAVAASREQFGQLRSIVEEQVRQQTMSEEPAPKPATQGAGAQGAMSGQGQGYAPRLQPQRDGGPRRDDRPREPQRAAQPGQFHAPFSAPQGVRRDDRPREPRPDHAARPVPTPPPADGADGFASLDSLKNALEHSNVPPKPRPAVPNGAQQSAGQPQKKGVTPESRNDLRSALAALVGEQKPKQAPAASHLASAQPKPEPRKEAQQPQPQPRQQAEPRPRVDESKRAEAPKERASAGIQEVPEEVLRKILE